MVKTYNKGDTMTKTKTTTEATTKKTTHLVAVPDKDRKFNHFVSLVPTPAEKEINNIFDAWTKL